MPRPNAASSRRPSGIVSGLSTFEDDNVVVVITPRHVRVGEEQLLALDLVAGSVEGDKQRSSTSTA